MKKNLREDKFLGNRCPRRLLRCPSLDSWHYWGHWWGDGSTTPDTQDDSGISPTTTCRSSSAAGVIAGAYAAHTTHTQKKPFDINVCKPRQCTLGHNCIGTHGIWCMLKILKQLLTSDVNNIEAFILWSNMVNGYCAPILLWLGVHIAHHQIPPVIRHKYEYKH